MNDENPPQPPGIPATPPAAPEPAFAAADQVPIASLAETFEALLRQPRRVLCQLGEARARTVIVLLFGLAVTCATLYGVVVGAFAGGTQLWAAPVKIAGGLLWSGLICLPSLYIFTCLAGGRATIGQVTGLVGGLLALMSLLLIGFAPIAWVFSQSTDSVPMMGFLHLAFWAVAMYFAVSFFGAGFRSLVARKDSGVMPVWLVVFVIVVLQMTTALRPLVGTSESFLPEEKRFFIGYWLDNLDASTHARTTNNER